MKRSLIYKAIRDRLLDCIEGLTVDVNRWQMSGNKINDYTIPMPLALISLSRIKWTVLDNEDGMERGLMEIIVDYYRFLVTDTYSGSESEEESVNFLDAPGDIYDALAYYESRNLFAPLYIKDETLIMTDSRLAGFRLTFETYVYNEPEE